MAELARLGFHPVRYANAWRRHPAWMTKMAARAVENTAPYKALDMTLKGNLISVPIVALMAATAPPGERAATVAAETAGVFTFPLFVAGIAALLPGGRFLSPGVRAFAATLGAAFPNMWLTENANRAFSRISHLERRTLRVETGGDYDDTETAQAFRLRAASDLASAFQPSRTWLGREAFSLRK